MRAVIQRVTAAAVHVDGEAIARIGPGLLVLLGVAVGDGAGEVAWMVRKLSEIRIFADETGKMNRSLIEAGGSVLLVSQFTLFGDAEKGRRPSFTRAAPPATAAPLVDQVVLGLRDRGLPVATGRFGAMMDVELTNAGPVTLILDTP
jgi:D-tyrosyl-tRNA(Tyr) deacylase